MIKTLNCAFLLGALAVAGGAQAAAATTQGKQHVDRAGHAEKARQNSPVRRAITPTASVSYSGTLAAVPSYNRTVESCAGLSAAGTAVGYSVQPFTVDTAGSYSVDSTQDYDGFIFVYTGTFNPANALTNCLAGDDDGAGANTSTIAAVTLATGTTYQLVTTSFSNGDSGTFTNTITGPGNITLAPVPAISFTKTTPGVVANSSFNYVLTFQNTGATNETVTVTDVLPAGLTYVSNTCGGTFAAGTFTWSLGTVNQGTPAASCSLTVSNTSPTCPVFSNTATATTVSGLSVSSTTSNGTAPDDPSLEASGPDGAPWASTSTNFDTVLCNASCANDPTNTPFDGDWWAWFAGLDPASTTATFPEVGTLSQSVVIPNGATQLRFKFRAGVCGGVAADFISVRVDGNEVFRVDGTNALCGDTDYSDQVANITPYANGAAHNIELYSEQSNTGSDTTNFFVDSFSFDVGACATTDVIFADGFDP